MMEYPPPMFLIVLAYLNGSITESEFVKMIALHKAKEDA